MRISILTLFPDMFTGPFDASIIKRAKDKKLLDIAFIQIRDFATDSYKTVDDKPYGGGAGMILRVDVVDRALSYAVSTYKAKQVKRILLDPQGTPFTQKAALQISHVDHLILLCAHYEGVDERIRSLVDEEISIGDFVLTGGEIPAMVIVDTVTRLLPGVLKTKEATEIESFSGNPPILEYPQYTRPQSYNGQDVPETLLSGNHKQIKEWRASQALIKTKARRSDLLK